MSDHRDVQPLCSVRPGLPRASTRRPCMHVNYFRPGERLLGDEMVRLTHRHGSCCALGPECRQEVPAPGHGSQDSWEGAGASPTRPPSRFLRAALLAERRPTCGDVRAHAAARQVAAPCHMATIHFFHCFGAIIAPPGWHLLCCWPLPPSPVCLLLPGVPLCTGWRAV